MKDTIEKAIENLAKRSQDSAASSNDALHHSQAALNLAHVLVVMSQIDKTTGG
jgi:hypothetical protein